MLSIVRLLRFASIAICIIVIASFAIFAVDQTQSASNHQTEEITGGPGVTASTRGGTARAPATHESAVHRTIDEASDQLTSPFAGVVSGSSSEWVIRGVKLLLALAVYGFGLGYLARTLRIRV
jgi:hypothetical protein